MALAIVSVLTPRNLDDESTDVTFSMSNYAARLLFLLSRLSMPRFVSRFPVAISSSKSFHLLLKAMILNLMTIFRFSSYSPVFSQPPTRSRMVPCFVFRSHGGSACTGAQHFPFLCCSKHTNVEEASSY